MCQKLRVDDVYGITRNIPLNYVERNFVDDKLRDNIHRNNHIVIFGSSKQGKTCLRKNCISDDEYIVIQCLSNWTLYDLNSAILKKAGYEITLSSKKSITGKNKIAATISAALFGLKSKIGGEEEKQEASETTSKTIDLDADDPNDIISALQSINFEKYIVLEDFHYLPVETQKQFAITLKSFHEASDYCFIIVGVWLDENRLIIYNGDLTGRVISVNADSWKREELMEVIEKGASLLNIKFSDEFKRELVSGCYDSVYIVQETCREACRLLNITESVIGEKVTIDINDGINIKEIIKRIVSQQDARYEAFIRNFSGGFQVSTTLEMPKWVLYAVLNMTSTQFERGISYREIKEILYKVHPKGKELNPGNLTLSLQSIASLQAKKDIKPFILDYNETEKKLNIVDKGFYIWMNTKDMEDLLDLADIELS